jgi:hypothetical protein
MTTNPSDPQNKWKWVTIRVDGMVVAQGYQCPDCKLVQQFGFESRADYVCMCHKRKKDAATLKDEKCKD